MTLSDYLVSIVRTVVPALVGLVLARFGINAMNVEGVPLETIATVLVIGGYYTAVRAAEKHWRWVGILLGWTAQPMYVKYAEPQRLHH